MLSEERNRLLCEVGPGTKMGALMRRYWQPIAAVSELRDTPTKPIRLLGEDLVAYRDSTNAYVKHAIASEITVPVELSVFEAIPSGRD